MDYAEILIVDDMPDQIAFAGTLLRSTGYRVFAVTSGKTAIQFLERKKPDLIMMDIQMEDMDGLKVCEIIKQNEKTKNIPVIFLTAETSPEIIQKGFSIGGCDYVKKPFIREEYLARVKTHLQVSKQQKELTAANNELNLFCSAVSHDLKAPFNVINMLIQMLQNELNEDITNDAKNIMNIIELKIKQTAVMIERLFEFSKMCNIEPQIKPVEIQDIILETFQDLKMLEIGRDIQMICDPLPLIKGDVVLIQMMIKNLLSNAIKYSKNKEKTIINITSEEDKLYQIIKIRDNGAGFDMNYADKLFQIFQRLHDDEEFEGSGVGLALVNRIMQRHKGKVSAWGKVGEGAEFSLYFLK